jgi:hypothetical protein
MRFYLETHILQPERSAKPGIKPDLRVKQWRKSESEKPDFAAERVFRMM